MATDTIALHQVEEETGFQTSQAWPVLLGHFIHDIYTAAVAPLLPVLIDKLSLSLTAAGSLSAIMQFPGILNPLIGYQADKRNLRWVVIMAPAVTATLISMMGYMPGYLSLAILLFAAGVSTACFHAPAPPMVARASGKQMGKGMSLFMAGGELGYTIGPLLVVWAVSMWGLEGMWRLMFLGWGATAVMAWRLRHSQTQSGIAADRRPGSLRAALPSMMTVFAPMALFALVRNPLIETISTYLPTFLNQQGASLAVAGVSLSILQVAGVVGVLSIGGLSDRIGRKRVLMVSQFLAPLLMLLFLQSGVTGWAAVALLFLIGLTAYSPSPLLMAIVQQRFPNNRAAANGLWMMTMFLLRPFGTLFVGMLGDRLGLEVTFVISALLAFLCVPAVALIPDRQSE